MDYVVVVIVGPEQAHRSSARRDACVKQFLKIVHRYQYRTSCRTDPFHIDRRTVGCFGCITIFNGRLVARFVCYSVHYTEPVLVNTRNYLLTKFSYTGVQNGGIPPKEMIRTNFPTQKLENGPPRKLCSGKVAQG